jgi:hypothetical protein
VTADEAYERIMTVLRDVITAGFEIGSWDEGFEIQKSEDPDSGATRWIAWKDAGNVW